MPSKDSNSYFFELERWRGSVERAIKDHDEGLEAVGQRIEKQCKEKHEKMDIALGEMERRLRSLEITWAKIIGVAAAVSLLVKYGPSIVEALVP